MNDNLICGGAEIYALNLKKILEKDNNDVKLLTFDKEFDKNILNIKNTKNITNISVSMNKISKLINKIIYNAILAKKIKNEINNFLPDLIILNTIFVSPITQMKACKGYKIIQIIHDYSVVCPKSTCIKEDYSICEGYKYNDCIKACKYHNSILQMVLKHNLVCRLEKLRKKMVDISVSPSQNLYKYLKKYGYNAVCINNPLQVSQLPQNEISDKLKKYIYIGNINNRKGIFRFIKVFKKFCKNKNVQLTLIGKPTSNENSEKLKELISDEEKIEYLGFIENEKIKEYMNKSDFVVVPSIWLENYPTTVIEAMASKSLVIGSTRGGIPEILSDGRGMMFDVLDETDIEKILNKTYNMTNEEYQNIITKAYEYIKDNNSFDTYLKKLKEIL